MAVRVLPSLRTILVLGVILLSVGQRTAGQQWSSIGPSPLTYQTNSQNYNSGRVSSLAVNPQDLNHWLMGAGNGGVWETRNAGATWTPLTDTAPTLAIGAIAFAPSNPQIIYAATGESVGQGFTKSGIGILKSMDGGQTWSVVGASSFNRAAVRTVRVHPSNPNVVLAISGRGGFGRDSQEGTPGSAPFGYLKSTDGGLTWTRTLNGLATSLQVDATNFNNQYAAIGDQRVGVNLFDDVADAVPNGVYRSSDGGQTWHVVNGPWGVSTTTTATVGRIELALAPSNPNVLYVGIQIPPNGGSSGTGLLGLYRTDNAWAATPTWTLIPTDDTGEGGYCGPGKCGYTHLLTVNPSDPNMLVAGGGSNGLGGLWRCSNCASSPTWEPIAHDLVHPDHHAFAWAANRLIDGNDGGVWSTTNLGASWQNHNSTLETAMFFTGALHPGSAMLMIGGLRDHALSVRTGPTAWRILPQLTDGREWGEAEVAISSTRPETDWMASWLRGMITRTTDGGVTPVPADAGIDSTGAAFVNPVRKCPANDDVFVTGTNRMWRSNNFFSAPSASWSANGPAHPYPFPDSLTAPGTILAIGFAATDPSCNTYVYGNRGGQIFLTTTGGGAWTALNAAGAIPARPVNSLAFDPANGNVLYAALSSFDSATPGKPGHVFKTSNALTGAPTWVDISPPGADIPFNVVAIDPRNPLVVYAGADVGLWRSTNGGASWARMGIDNGLPNAPVYDVKINASTGDTAVFTYGRGAFVWRSTFTDEPLDNSVTIKAVHITELRTRINLVRERLGLPAASWSDAALAPGAALIRAVHVAELRVALDAAYAAVGRPAPSYTDPSIVAGQTMVRAVHLNELRAALLAIE